MADAVGLAAKLDEPPVVDDAVDRGGGHLVVPEHRPPPAELQVRRDYRQPPLVCVSEDLEEQPRPVRVERKKPELVDDEQAGLADERGLPVEPPVVAGAPQAHHERGRREEACLEPPLARQRAEGRRHVRLAGADVAHEREIGLENARDSFLVALEREPAPSLGHRRDGRHVLHVGVLRHGVPVHMEHSGDFGPRAPGGIHRPYIIHRGQGHGHLLHPSRAGSPK